MPTVLQQTTSPGFTAQTVLNSVSQDMRQLISASANADATLLLDYVNRIQLDLLRFSPWTFNVSNVKRFITEPLRTDYWLGATGSNLAGTVDTGLNLSDLGRIRKDSVMDRSNYVPLDWVSEAPLTTGLAYQDTQSRPGRPAVWRNDPNSPNVINIYPAPDNNNSYQMVPEDPIVTSQVSGALALRTYYVKATYVDSSGGESTASLNSVQETIPANSVCLVASPTVPIPASSTGVQYTQWRCYIGTVLGSEQLQATLNIGSNFTEPNTGLIAGVTPPGTSTLAALNGYIIEFRYLPARPQVTAAGTVLVVPIDFKDVFVAGVNWLAAMYLRRFDEAKAWNAIYSMGKQSMIRDKNMFPKGDEFIRPDQASVGMSIPSSFDQNLGINS